MRPQVVGMAAGVGVERLWNPSVDKECLCRVEEVRNMEQLEGNLEEDKDWTIKKIKEEKNKKTGKLLLQSQKICEPPISFLCRIYSVVNLSQLLSFILWFYHSPLHLLPIPTFVSVKTQLWKHDIVFFKAKFCFKV